MSRKKRRKSFLERAEDNILEHIPAKYQKSLVGVYRFGFFVNIIGIICAIITLFLIIGFFFIEKDASPDSLITRIVLFAAFFGIAVLGARYTKMKMAPNLAFGWAIFLGLTGLILSGFFGFVLFVSFAAHLDQVYGQAMMLMVQAILAGLMVLPLVIFLNAAYYLFFAHRGYLKWYADYAKRHHLGEEAKIVKKSSTRKKKTEEYSDEDL